MEQFFWDNAEYFYVVVILGYLPLMKFVFNWKTKWTTIVLWSIISFIIATAILIFGMGDKL